MADRRPRIDLDELRAALVDRLEVLADTLMGSRNAALSTQKRWRWGGKGSLALEMSGRKRGAWHSHEANEGGGPIQFIQQARRCTFAKAVEWGADWTGLSAATDADRATYVADDAKRKAERVARLRADAAAEEANRRERIADARRLVAEAVPIDGTAAEIYLTATRAIPRPDAGWPDTVRWHPSSRALLLVATDAAGDVRAVQRVFLTPAGQKVGDEEIAARRLQRAKTTKGVLLGAAVRLPGPAGSPLIVCEGPETGLSAWRATGAETWIACGSLSNITPPFGRRVVACRDDDPLDSPAEKALAARIDMWRAAGIDLTVAQPWPQRRGDHSDLNDTLLAGGLAAVRARIEAALVSPGPGAPPPSGGGGAATAARRVSVAEGRATLRKAVTAFYAAALAWAPSQDATPGGNGGEPPAPSNEDEYGALEPDEAPAPPAGDTPPVHMVQIDTGGGKTAEALRGAAMMLADLRGAGDRRNVVIATPTHRLSGELVERFVAQPEAREAGLTAQVWRGRRADDPENPGRMMCQNYPAFREVQALKLDAEKQVCGICPHGPAGAGDCRYIAQRSLRGDAWFVAHNMAFEKAPAALGKVAALVVDEDPLGAALEGVERDRDRPKERSAITLDLSVLARVDHTDKRTDTDRLMFLRGRALGVMASADDGPLARDALMASGLTSASAREAIALEWRTLIEVQLTATMTSGERSAALATAARNGDLGRRVMWWKALAALLADDGPQFSGWAKLATDKGGTVPVRFLELKGRKEVGRRFRAPTLALDATGRRELLRYIWPDLQQTADVRLLTPHLRVHQTTATDQALSRLDVESAKGEAEHNHRTRNLRSMHAIICREARRHAPAEVLVVAQKRVREALVGLGNIPGNVAMGHHNSLRGIDRYGNAAALIVIGRTLPTSTTIAAMTEALTGVAQEALSYQRGETTREVSDGRMIPATWWRYLDPIGDALRWQATEAEVVQLVGRLRGANRTPANPADVLLLTDLPVPLPVEPIDMAELAPGPADRMLAAGGVAFANPTDAAQAYPDLWGNRDAAKKAFQRGSWGHSCIEDISYTGMSPTGLRRVDYQRQGARLSPAAALFDPALIPDIEAALTAMLGPLSACRVADGPPAEPATQEPAEDAPMPQLTPLAAAPIVPGCYGERLDPAAMFPVGSAVEPIAEAWTVRGREGAVFRVITLAGATGAPVGTLTALAAAPAWSPLPAPFDGLPPPPPPAFPVTGDKHV